MIINLPKDFYYEKDDAKAYIKDGNLFCENNMSFERLMYHITYVLRGKDICYYCGCDLNEKNRTLDHMYPRDFGGVSITNNLVPCCIDCNQKKNNLTLEEFFDWMNIQDPKKRKQRKNELLHDHEKYRYENGFYLPKEWYQYMSDRVYVEILLTEEFKQGKRYNFISEFYEKYNHLPRPIVKSANNRLLDGFLVLLFAKENQIEQIPCINIENVWDIS